MKPDDLSANRLAIDVRQADDLRLKLKQSPREGLKQVAQQFESLFIGMMLKSMRDTLPQDGLFSSDQTRLYTSMLDQQLAQKLSTSGQLGFARLIEQQMGRFLPPEEGAAGEGGGAKCQSGERLAGVCDTLVRTGVAGSDAPGLGFGPGEGGGQGRGTGGGHCSGKCCRRHRRFCRHCISDAGK